MLVHLAAHIFVIVALKLFSINYCILFEFLFLSLFLCLIKGLIIYVLTAIFVKYFSFRLIVKVLYRFMKPKIHFENVLRFYIIFVQ